MFELNKKKIFYDKNATFDIMPHLSEKDVDAFKQYIESFQKTIFETHHENCFFWEYNEETNKIIINENAYAIQYFILNQLTIMAEWLFKNKYYIKGSFHYRINNTIEYITANDNKSLINHHILYDDKKLKEFYENNINIEEIGSKIIFDAKNKIKKYVDVYHDHNKCSPKENIKNNILYTIVDSIEKEEYDIIVRSMQERIFSLENKQKSQAKVNKFLFRICTVIGLLTAGTIVLSLHFNKEKFYPLK